MIFKCFISTCGVFILLACGAQSASEPQTTAGSGSPEKAVQIEPKSPQAAAFKKLSRKNLDKGVYWLDADQNGWEDVSFILAPMPPGEGPALHTHHDADEYHVVMEGSATYVFGNPDGTLSMYEANGPFVARIPTGTPHAVENRAHHHDHQEGKEIVNIIGVFPADHVRKSQKNWFNGTLSGFPIHFEEYPTADKLIDALLADEEKRFAIQPMDQAPQLKPVAKSTEQ